MQVGSISTCNEILGSTERFEQKAPFISASKCNYTPQAQRKGKFLWNWTPNKSAWNQNKSTNKQYHQGKPMVNKPLIRPYSWGGVARIPLIPGASAAVTFLSPKPLGWSPTNTTFEFGVTFSLTHRAPKRSRKRRIARVPWKLDVSPFKLFTFLGVSPTTPQQDWRRWFIRSDRRKQ